MALPHPKDESPGTASDPDSALEQAIYAFQQGRDRDKNFRLVYERYFPALRAFFSRKGCTADESLDLTQDTFLRIYLGLKGYRHEQRFAGWLYRVATTTYLKKLRSASTAKRSGLEISQEELPEARGDLAVASSQLSALLDRERQKALRQAVQDLPPQMQACLTLRVYQELSYREIAVILKLSAETVKAHLARARQRLREHLGPELLNQLAPDGGSSP